MTYTTVELAVLTAERILEVEHIACDTNSIRSRVYSWYEHSDVTDPEILAACALSGKDWYPAATYKDMLEAYEYWFPSDPYENIPIWEIEAAQHDEFWR